MKTIDFVLDVIGSTLSNSYFGEFFLPSNLGLWLKKHQWVEDPHSPCLWCKGKADWFSEKKCKENVEQGGSCYRETLKSVFIPFVRNALAGECPPIRELGKIVHKKAPLHHDGIPGNFTLIGMIAHELGGISLGQSSNEITEADQQYIEKLRKFFKEREIFKQEDLL